MRRLLNWLTQRTSQAEDLASIGKVACDDTHVLLRREHDPVKFNDLKREESSSGRHYYKNSIPEWIGDYPIISGNTFFDFEVAGASHYQDDLSMIVGGPRDASVYYRAIAVLSREPENKHDKNAIAVRINGRTVAYIKREHNASFAEQLNKAAIFGDVQCRAMIVGGWNHGQGDRGKFGVRLDVTWPIEARYSPAEGGRRIIPPIFELDPRFREIGRLDDLCPYCQFHFAARPSKKTKCMNCGDFVLVRTRPFDRQRVLVTEKEALLLEAEWVQFMDSKRYIKSPT